MHCLLPKSANDQQLISREYLHTAPEQPALPPGCFAAGTAFGRGVCSAHSGACWMQKQVLALFHRQALLPVRQILLRDATDPLALPVSHKLRLMSAETEAPM